MIRFSHYYEILTKAAPTNWDYLIAAGRFEEDYMADYNRAMNYQLSALNTTDNDTYKATSYIIIGGIYEKLDDYSKALECYEKSLKIRLSVYGENDEIVANDYELWDRYISLKMTVLKLWNIMKSL